MTKSTAIPNTASSVHAPLGFKSFVALMAAMMALNALATDMMLPAFPLMAHDFGLTNANRIQLIISAYLIGLGSGQMFVGVLADRYGRKVVLLTGIALYSASAIWVGLTQDFTTLLCARLLQGLGAAVLRVSIMAIIRDCYSGRKMARVLSLNMMVTMVAPIMAPILGQGILFVATWQYIFWALALYGVLVLIISGLRLPETLAPNHRRAIKFSVISNALGSIFRSKQTMGYTLAGAASSGALMGFINSSQQLLVDVYHTGNWFVFLFGSVAFSMSVAAFTNARFVERLGMRWVGHAATLAFLVIAIVMVGVALLGYLNLVIFIILLMILMFFKGLSSANYVALAIARQGHIAGVASSVIGSLTVLTGAFIGFVIGQMFNGTSLPLVIGFLIVGIIQLAMVLAAENGRLFGDDPD